MNYAVEMGAGVMIYIPSFIKVGSDNQKLMGRLMVASYAYFYFFK
jgi:hypothetical protein